MDNKLFEVIQLIPKHSNRVATRALCIDPAISRVGWSILDYKLGCGKIPPSIDVVRWGNIAPGPEAKKVANRDLCERFTQRVVALHILRAEISALIEEFCPDHIVIEDSFYNPKFPSAYATLVQCITTITFLAKDRYGKPVYMVPTRSAKKSVCSVAGGGGGSDKTDVLAAILSSPYINFKQKKKTFELDYHAADSIAVGIHFISEMWSPTLAV